MGACEPCFPGDPLPCMLSMCLCSNTPDSNDTLVIRRLHSQITSPLLESGVLEQRHLQHAGQGVPASGIGKHCVGECGRNSNCLTPTLFPVSSRAGRIKRGRFSKARQVSGKHRRSPVTRADSISLAWQQRKLLINSPLLMPNMRD